MSVPIGIAILAPAGAAVLALVFGRVRLWMAAGATGGLGGAVATLVVVVADGPIAAHGFEADPWRAGLAVVAALVFAAGAVAMRDLDEHRAPAALAALGAGTASLFAVDVVGFAALLVATTAAFGLAGRWPRGLTAYVVGDLAGLAGLVLASGSGMVVPPHPGGGASAFLLFAAAVRCTLPLAPGARAAAIGGGPMRAQGLAMAAWVAGSDAASAMAVGGAVLAALCARRAVRDRSAVWAQSALGALALAGLGVGGAAATRGAVLVAAGAMLGATILVLGRAAEWSPAMAAAPLGAAFPGAALIAASSLEAGLGGGWVLAAGAGVAMATGWLAQAGAAGLGAAEPPAPGAGWAWIPAMVSGAVAILPTSALAQIGGRASQAFGVGEPLAGLPTALPDEAGLVLGAAALGAALAILPARVPRAAALRHPVAPQLPPPGSLALMPLAAGIAAGLTVLFGVGLHRGFL